MEEKKVMIYKWLKEESAKHFDWVDTIFFVRDSIYSDKKSLSYLLIRMENQYPKN